MRIYVVCITKKIHMCVVVLPSAFFYTVPDCVDIPNLKILVLCANQHWLTAIFLVLFPSLVLFKLHPIFFSALNRSRDWELQRVYLINDFRYATLEENGQHPEKFSPMCSQILASYPRC